MLNSIKIFDYFGYTPQFRINGDTVYKSFLGGIIFMCFIIFALYYLISQFSIYLLTHKDVKTSTTRIKISNPYYTLTTKDIYFGIGLVDKNQIELNLTSYPYFDLQLKLVVANITNSISTYIDLEKCNYSLFSIGDDLNTDITLKTKIIKKISYYYCPMSNFTFNITPDSFENGHIYLDFKLSFTNYSIYDKAYIDLLNKKIFTNFVFKQIGLNIESKTQPYQSFPENTLNIVDPEFVKRTEMRISPLEIMDDDDAFSLGSFKYYKNNIVSSQINGTTFQFSRDSDYFEHIGNRTNLTSLDLNRLILRLNTSCRVSLRIFQKFSDFLASVGAIISNFLLIIVILMTKINQINGKHLLLKSMFSYNVIKNIKKFKKEAKAQFNKKSNVDEEIKENKMRGKQNDDINLEISEDNITQKRKILNKNNNLYKLSDIIEEPDVKLYLPNDTKKESLDFNQVDIEKGKL